MAATNAAKQRKMRQDTLREWLSEKCTAQHLVDNINKIEKLNVDDETFKNQLDKLKVANEQRFKVLNKYMPDLKQTEMSLTGEDGGPVEIAAIERTIIDPASEA